MGEQFVRDFILSVLALGVVAIYFLMLFSSWKSRHHRWFYGMLVGFPVGVGFVLAIIYRIKMYEGPAVWRRQRMQRMRERARLRRAARRRARRERRDQRRGRRRQRRQP